MAPGGAAGERAAGGVSYEEILACEGYPDGSDTPVYLAGSIVMPFANPWSDIDVYAISDRESLGVFAIPEGDNVVSQHFAAGKRIDYEFWRPAAVRALGERLAGLQLGDGANIPRQVFNYAEECFLHRLRTGVALLNDAELDAWRGLFDFAKLSDYQSQEVIRELDGVYEDVCGMLEGDDLDVAELSARNLVGLSLAAYLHQRGSADPSPKWRPRYLQLLDDGSALHREISETYPRLEFPESAGPRASASERRSYVEACIAFSRRITSWVQS